MQIDVRIGQLAMTVHVPAAPMPAAAATRAARHASGFSPARHHLRAGDVPWP
jgi:hypothetical protein